MNVPCPIAWRSLVAGGRLFSVRLCAGLVWALLLGGGARADALLKTTDQSIPKTSAVAERVIQRAFWLGAVLAALLYRSLARRWFSDPVKPCGVKSPE